VTSEMILDNFLGRHGCQQTASLLCVLRPTVSSHVPKSKVAFTVTELVDECPHVSNWQAPLYYIFAQILTDVILMKSTHFHNFS